MAWRPRYAISNQILNQIARIEAAREVILAAPLVPRYEVKFRTEAMARTIYHGTHIEGSPLAKDEVQKVVEGGEQKDKARNRETEGTEAGAVIGRARHFQEVINYRRVLEFIEAVVQNRPSVLKRRFEIKNLEIQGKNGQFNLTEDVIRYLHRIVVDRIVPPKEAGHYRRVGVVLRNSVTGKVSFHPPVWQEVPDLMESLVDWLNSEEGKEIHPVLKAGIIHYELAWTHPFTEGNGRTARATATLSLFTDGYDIRRFFSLEEYFDQNPNDYFGTLQKVSNQLVGDESKRDLTPWLEYFSQGVAAEFERIKERVQMLSLDSRLKSGLGKQIELSERQVKLVEFIENHRRLRNEDFRTILPMVSEDTVRRDLAELIRKKLVDKKGKTKAARYELRQR